MARVVITRELLPRAAEALRAAGHDVEVLTLGDYPQRGDVLRGVRGADGLIATITDRVDAEFLAGAGPQLRIVANYAVGFDNIDLAACRAAGVVVTNTPGVLSDATADLAWALILATARRVVEGDRLVRSGGWQGLAPTQLLGLELRGATLGIVGAGRIGTATALRSLGFGMRVLYTHPRANAELEARVGARRVELHELLRMADIVSLHVPLRPETRRLIGASELALMPPHALLINTARGPVIDEAALIAALRGGRPAAAGLDVYEREPALTPGLADLPNVVLMPHVGSATHATRTRMAAMAAENVIAVLAGLAPPNPVSA